MRANLPLVVIIIALVVAPYSVPRAQESEDDDVRVAESEQGAAVAEESTSEEQDQEEVGPLDRSWYEFRGLGELGYDWNPLVSDSPTTEDELWGWGLDAKWSYSRFRSAKPSNHLWDRHWIGGVEFEGEGTRYKDTAAADRQSLTGRFYFEWAPQKISNLNPEGEGRKAFRLKGLQGLSLGALARYSTLRAASAPFLKSYGGLGAVAYSWSRSRECDLTKLIVFGSGDRIDDRTDATGSALDQSGRFTAVGARFSWVDTPKGDQVCMGGGIFRDPLLYDYATFRLEWQTGWQDADGTEFDRDVTAYLAGGSMPLRRKGDVVRLLFDGEFEYDTTSSRGTAARGACPLQGTPTFASG